MPSRVGSDRYLPVLVVLGSTVALQLGQVIAFGLFDQASPTAVVWLRFGFSAVVFWLIARPRLRGRSREEWRWVVGFGLTFTVLNWSFYESMSRIPMGLAVTIEFLGPLVVAVLGSRRPLDLLWVTLAALGVAVLSFEHGSLTFLGVAFSVVAGAAWGVYIIVSKRVGQLWHGFEGLAIASSIAAVIATPFALLGDGTGHPPRFYGLAAAMAVLTFVIPYALELIVLRRIAPAVFSILLSLEPAMAALAGLAFLDQRIAPLQWLAIGFVIAASLGATVRGSSDKPREETGAIPVL